ncbi:MAG: hypothetical protein ACOYL3_05390 [Desulfuromonadaceae bacterium]
MSYKPGLIYGIIACCACQLIAACAAHAIPAFSRAHKVECTTCHTIAPELNEYGEAFLKNSYVYVGKEKSAAQKAPTAPVTAKKTSAGSSRGTAVTVMGEGDANQLNKLKAGALGTDGAEQTVSAPVSDTAVAVEIPGDVKPEGLVLAGIPEMLPISFTGAINYTFGDGRNITNGNEFDYSARAFKLHAAGNFREKIGFFATYVAYSEQPPGGTYNTSEMPSNNKTDINEMFLQLRNFLDTPLNLKIGRMQPKLGLWKTNNKLSVTNNYLPYSYTVGHESVFKVDQPQDVIELNTLFAGRLFVAGGIVNRKGQNSKEGYGHISCKIGGADYLGNETDIDLFKEERILDFLAVTIGGYAYYGENGPGVSGTPRNSYERYGVDTELQYKIFRLRMLGGWGSDSNVDPIQTAASPKVISKAGTIESEFSFRTNLIAAARFDYLQELSDYHTLFSNRYVRRYVGTVAYAPLQNVKLSTEYKYEITQDVINRIGTVGATFSF